MACEVIKQKNSVLLPRSSTGGIVRASTLTVGSLFSGFGLFDLGFKRAGFEILWQCEIDEYARQVLEKHYPGVPRYGDIRTLQDALPRPDIVIGGPPCQPVSNAGKRLGRTDDRFLWGEAVDVVCRVRPRVALLENPPGILTHDRGRTFGWIVGRLAEGGWDCAWDCIPAAVVGAPHLRERLFLVAHSAGGRLDADSIFHHAIAQALRQEQGFWGRHSQRVSTTRGRVRLVPDDRIFRMADGAYSGMDRDRIKGLGNGVVPEVAEMLARGLAWALEDDGD